MRNRDFFSCNKKHFLLFANSLHSSLRLTVLLIILFLFLLLNRESFRNLYSFLNLSTKEQSQHSFTQGIQKKQ